MLWKRIKIEGLQRFSESTQDQAALCHPWANHAHVNTPQKSPFYEQIPWEFLLEYFFLHQTNSRFLSMASTFSLQWYFNEARSDNVLSKERELSKTQTTPVRRALSHTRNDNRNRSSVIIGRSEPHQEKHCLQSDLKAVTVAEMTSRWPRKFRFICFRTDSKDKIANLVSSPLCKSRNLWKQRRDETSPQTKQSPTTTRAPSCLEPRTIKSSSQDTSKEELLVMHERCLTLQSHLQSKCPKTRCPKQGPRNWCASSLPPIPHMLWASETQASQTWLRREGRAYQMCWMKLGGESGFHGFLGDAHDFNNSLLL